jgi:hypothetical protein
MIHEISLLFLLVLWCTEHYAQALFAFVPVPHRIAQRKCSCYDYLFLFSYRPSLIVGQIDGKGA